MSGFFRPRNLVIAGGIVAGVVLFPRTIRQATPVGNPFETQAVRNIGDRYLAGGGSNTHTPGVATTRGDSKSVTGPQANSNGPGSASHEHKLEGRPEQPGVVSKAFRQAHYGNDKGK